MTPEEIRAIVRQEIRALLSPLVGEEAKDEWVDAATAARKLGYPNTDRLYAAVRQGVFRIGKEVVDRRAPGAKRPRYRFDLEACRARLRSDPERRRVV